MLESGREKELLQEIDTLSITGDQITGCLELDAMLWQKQRCCDERGIDFEINFNLPEVDNVNIVDLIGLLGNMLDNAIEACERMEIRGEVMKGIRYIKMYSGIRANVWSIKIENSKRIDEQPEKTEFFTEKPNKEEHGIGMRIIRRIVNKYDGIIECRNKGDIYIMIVSLQMEDENDRVY